MLTRFSVRRKSKDIFQKVTTLRKQGHSYSEIIKETGVAKSTINSWINFAGLNLSPEHLQIQLKKRVENHVLGTEASKITRLKRKDEDIQRFIQTHKNHIDDPLFNFGIALYESEGSKGDNNCFSNSDFRLIQVFIKFTEKYFGVSRYNDMSFRLYIHELRKKDLNRILNFWSNKLNIQKDRIKISWKHNIVTQIRTNLNYVGQLSLHIMNVSHLTSKLLAISDIILHRYQKI